MAKVGDIVEVVWTDAKMWGALWIDSEEALGYALPICYSWGCVLSQTEEELKLIQSKSDGDVANELGIPVACIKSIEVLKEGK